MSLITMKLIFLGRIRRINLHGNSFYAARKVILCTAFCAFNKKNLQNLKIKIMLANTGTKNLSIINKNTNIALPNIGYNKKSVDNKGL